MTSSTGRSRRPWGPASVATAPAAMSAGTLSAAGEPLHRLPPRVARPCTWVEPMRLAASITPGHTCLSRGCSFSSAPVTAAPMRQPPFSSVIGACLGDLLDVDDQLRVDDVGAHLDQEVGASGQHAGLARRPREQGDRSFQRLWCLVSHVVVSPSVGRCELCQRQQHRPSARKCQRPQAVACRIRRRAPRPPGSPGGREESVPTSW